MDAPTPDARPQPSSQQPRREGAPLRPQRVIALMNQKGGVGKTTTTVNLAAAFARAGRSTLVVDLDPQAHATLHLGVDPAEVHMGVYNALVDTGIEPASTVRRVRDNLAIMPAVTDLAGVETELANAPDRQRRLEKALLALADRYEFVLLDCPPSLGLLTINGLSAAREVIIPMQAHYLAMQGVGKLLETIQLVTANINPDLRVLGVVLCMHDNASTHTREVVAEVESFFKQARGIDVPWKHARVVRPPVRRNIKLAEAPSYGQTIFEYAPNASGSEDYNAIAWSLLGEWDAMLAQHEEAEVVVPARKVAGKQPSTVGASAAGASASNDATTPAGTHAP